MQPSTHGSPSVLLSLLALLAASACASSNQRAATTPTAAAPGTPASPSAAPAPTGRAVLGVLTGHGEGSVATELSYLPALLQGLHIEADVRDVTLQAGAVPDGVTGLLVLATPQTVLPPDALRALDAYLARGGNVAVFASGLAVRTTNQFDAELAAARHGLSPWLETYGVRLGANLVLDERNLEAVIQLNGQNARVRLPTWPRVPHLDAAQSAEAGFTQSPLDATNPITRDLDAAAFPFASSLTLVPLGTAREDVTTRVLARSSPRSFERSGTGAVELAAVLGEARAGVGGAQHGPYALAVVLDGLANNDRSEAGRLVVVSSSVFPSLLAQRIPMLVNNRGNVRFMENLARYLTGTH